MYARVCMKRFGRTRYSELYTRVQRQIRRANDPDIPRRQSKRMTMVAVVTSQLWHCEMGIIGFQQSRGNNKGIIRSKYDWVQTVMVHDWHPLLQSAVVIIPIPYNMMLWYTNIILLYYNIVYTKRLFYRWRV